jgi:hypothetical protein
MHSVILKCASAQRFAQRYAQLSLALGKIEALARKQRVLTLLLLLLVLFQKEI